MRLTLDSEVCAGHGRCYELAPELFEPDDEGHAVLLVDGELSSQDEAAAQVAVRNCPERALRTLC
jgi:ferredoxin